jgi:hypothetical protein
MRIAKDFITNEPITMDVITTNRVAKGNYKFINPSSVTITINEGIPATQTHLTGTRADIDLQVEIIGTATLTGLANIIAYCKANDFFYESDGEQFHIITGKANKYHALTSLIKTVDTYAHIDFVTGDIFDTYTNDYISTVNFKGKDVVLTMQASKARGYKEPIITARGAYIPNKK